MIHHSNHQVAATLISLLAIGSVFATPAVAQDVQLHQHPSSIRGTVINALTNEPISRALVYTSDNRFARFTDGEGHFDYPLPPANTGEAGLSGIELQSQSPFTLCCIMARKPGFLNDPNQGRVEVASGSEPVIALIPESLIKGRVALPSSEGAPGITVQIFSHEVEDGKLHWVPYPPVRTNSSGEFRFAELRPGEYKIVTHELMDPDPSTMASGGKLYGFPPVYFPGAVDFDAATPIQLKAGQSFEATLSPVRQPYYPVRIPVAEDAGNGVVTVSIQGHDSPGYSLGYRMEKNSIEGLLPNGTYLVSMESFGPNSASGTVTVTVSDGPAQTSKMVLSRLSSIQFNVTEEFNAKDENRTATWSNGGHSFELHGPRLDLQAMVEPVGELNFRGGRTVRPPAGPGDDTLVIEDVAPGRHRLHLFASRGYVASATAGGVDLLEKPLSVSTGSTITVDVLLRDDFAEIDGSLTNMSSALNGTTTSAHSRSFKPPAYVYFVPQPGSTGQFLQIGADPEGKFHLTNIAPGKYLVLAFEQQRMNLPYRESEAMRAYESKGRMVRLAPGQKEKLELQIISSHD